MPNRQIENHVPARTAVDECGNHRRGSAPIRTVTDHDCNMSLEDRIVSTETGEARRGAHGESQWAKSLDTLAACRIHLVAPSTSKLDEPHTSPR